MVEMVEGSRTRFYARGAVQWIGGGLALYGVLILMAWQIGWVRLIDLFPGHGITQNNTGLCFFLAGSFLLWRSPRSRSVATLLALLTGATLLEYLTGAGFGIDEFLVKDYLVLHTSHPGRMAPNTALCFLFCGLAGALAWPFLHGLAGSVISSLGLLGLSGYMVGVESAYGWGRMTRMSPQTAVGMMLLGLALVGLAWSFHDGKSLFPPWLLGALGLSCLILVTGAAVFSSNEERRQTRFHLEKELETETVALKLRLERCFDSVQRIAARWDDRGGTPRHEWELDAARYLATIPELRAVEKVNARGQVIWCVPRRARCMDLSNDQSRRKRLRMAAASGKPVHTREVELAQGGLGWLYLVPQRSPGLTVAVFRYSDLFRNTLPTHGLSVSVDGVEVYRRELAGTRVLVSRSFTIDGHRWRMEAREGAQELLNLWFLPLSVGGLFLLLVAFVRLVLLDSEQRHQEQVLLAGRRAEDLERFAHAAAHDLMEPLRATAGCLTLLEQRCSELPERSRRLLQEAVGGAERMGMLLKGIRELNGLDQQPFRLERVQVEEVVDGVRRSLAQLIGDAQAEVDYQGISEFRGDAVHLSLLLQNLVTNAIRYRHPNREPRIFIEARHRERGVEFSVYDNGLGIAPAHREQIFEAFKRLHSRSHSPGTGLGLALCRKIVRLHGGEIWCEPRIGEGSVFRFTLRRRKRS